MNQRLIIDLRGRILQHAKSVPCQKTMFRWLRGTLCSMRATAAATILSRLRLRWHPQRCCLHFVQLFTATSPPTGPLLRIFAYAVRSARHSAGSWYYCNCRMGVELGPLNYTQSSLRISEYILLTDVLGRVHMTSNSVTYGSE